MNWTCRAASCPYSSKLPTKFDFLSDQLLKIVRKMKIRIPSGSKEQSYSYRGRALLCDGRAGKGPATGGWGGGPGGGNT